MHTTCRLLLLPALLCTGMAYAQPRFLAKYDEQFVAADKDGDGALTRQEAEQANLRRIVERFDAIDANQDKKVTREEIRAMLRSRLPI